MSEVASAPAVTSPTPVAAAKPVGKKSAGRKAKTPAPKAAVAPKSPKAPKATKVAPKAAPKAEVPAAKAPANHPPYLEMVVKAIKDLKEHKGASRQGLLKFILANFQVGPDVKAVNNHLRMALKRAVKGGQLKNPGDNINRFKLAEKTAAAAPLKKAKSTVAKKPKTAAAAAKKPTVTVAVKKSPKKVAAAAKKSPAKKAPKPAAPKVEKKVVPKAKKAVAKVAKPKSPAKKAVKKAPVKKVVAKKAAPPATA